MRALSTLGAWHGAVAEWRVSLKSLPFDASDVAVLVQQTKSGAMIGAARVALPDAR